MEGLVTRLSGSLSSYLAESFACQETRGATKTSCCSDSFLIKLFLLSRRVAKSVEWMNGWVDGRMDGVERLVEELWKKRKKKLFLLLLVCLLFACLLMEISFAPTYLLNCGKLESFFLSFQASIIALGVNSFKFVFPNRMFMAMSDVHMAEEQGESCNPITVDVLKNLNQILRISCKALLELFLNQ